eukprot:NODE_5442_length_1769_cov_31.568210.p1 GENE.NODE_5442_length_1769_cov_31.568210~~NODE_5442_length_1769_cov_31.568210.p1  ORF type:complete len:498 (+),score=102.45 NODE_5442_length_1769_cov_31.568210:105-1496(+)
MAGLHWDLKSAGRAVQATEKASHCMKKLVLPADLVWMRSVWLKADSAETSWERFSLATSEGARCGVGKVLGELRVKPLLCFVNSRSGGRQGLDVVQQLRALLHELQVVDLGVKGASPDDALVWWSRNVVSNYRILVCGGDGTAAWVLSRIEALSFDYVAPVAILPLGTGNDLARVLGWGGGYQGGSVLDKLLQLSRAEICFLDRWTVSFQENLTLASPGRMSTSLTSLRRTWRAAKPREPVGLCNYIGIGIGAAVTLSFHRMRERRPSLFVSRVLNKVWYAMSGLRTFMQGNFSLATSVMLICDGEEVELPQDLQGIIVLNIGSYGGGCDLWSNCYTGGASEAHQSMQDKKLDVVGVRSIMELTAAQVGLSGLSNTVRLAQAGNVVISTNKRLPVQIDGEPFKVDAGTTIDIDWESQAMMLANSAGEVSATEVVEWGLQNSIIDASQRAALLMEIATRRTDAA